MNQTSDHTVSIAQINQAVMNQTEELSGFGTVEKTIGPVVQYCGANQWFSLDSYNAYDVTPFGMTDEKDGSHHIWTPIVINGSTFLSFPDEGQSGMLMEWKFSGRRPNRLYPDGSGTRLIWGPVRWLRREEIELSPSEIMDNLADEITAGKNVFTQPPPGWV